MGTPALPQHHHVRTAVASVTRSADGATYVEGIAYPSLDPPADGPIPRAEAALRIDSYVTWMRRATLERFAHQFLRHGRAIDSGHDHREVGELVESYLTGPGHPTYPADVWVTRVMTRDPATIEALDKGELKGFSIEFVSPIAIVPLKIEGEGGAVQTVRTGEITDPLPLYLSLVERPSIGVPFEVVQMRGEQHGQRTQSREFVQARSDGAADALGRVTRVVSVASPESAETPENRGAHGEPTTMDKPDTEARATDGATTAPTTTAQATSEPAGAVTTAPAEPLPEQPATQLRSVRDAITPERREALDAIARRSDAPYDLAACWVECKDSLTMWDGFCNALYLYENVYWNIRYCTEPEGVQAAMIEKAAADFARIVSGIARAFPGYVASAAADEAAEAAAAIAADIATDGAELAAVQGRSAQPTVPTVPATPQARAGKVLSAANREKIQCARDACATGMGHLDELLAIGAAVEEATEEAAGEGASSGEARSAQPTAPTPPDQPAATDPIAALRAEFGQRIATLESRQSADAAALAQTRADLEAANARTTEATAARDAAQRRVAELEGMRPAARTSVDEHEAVLTGAQGAQGTSGERRSVWAGTLFPADSTE